MNRITADASAAADTLVTLFPSAADMAVRIGGVLAVMGALAPWLALFLFLGGIFSGGTFHFAPEMDEAGAPQGTGGRRKGSQFSPGKPGESADNPGFWMSGENRIQRSRADEWASEGAPCCNLLSNGFATGLNALFQCAYLAGFLWGTSGILAHTVSYGTLTAVMQLIGQLQAPFGESGRGRSKAGGALGKCRADDGTDGRIPGHFFACGGSAGSL